jgi:hypothetical protein
MRAWKVNEFGEPADVLTLDEDAESCVPRRPPG